MEEYSNVYTCKNQYTLMYTDIYEHYLCIHLVYINISILQCTQMYVNTIYVWLSIIHVIILQTCIHIYPCILWNMYIYIYIYIYIYTYIYVYIYIYTSVYSSVYKGRFHTCCRASHGVACCCIALKVCCRVLHCVAGLQGVARRCRALQCIAECHKLHGVVVCCRALQGAAGRCRDAERCNMVQCVAVWCNVMQCVAVCCSVLQCVAGRDLLLMPRKLFCKFDFG